MPQVHYSQVCDGYSCMWCDRCPNGTYWKVPEEDMEQWMMYQNKIKEYHKKHNPCLYDVLYNNDLNKEDNSLRLILKK